jgi:hypothetical protein
LVFDPVEAATTTFTARDYGMSWYQPKYASTYSASALRRYNGGKSDGDKVKGYCISTRLLSASATVSKGIVANSATVTLSRAAAITAGAIALGVVALAI